MPVVNGAVSFGLASMLMLTALQKAGIAITVALLSTQLLWITLLSAIFLRERITPKTILGVAVTTIGVTLVVL
jgi:drug/metabolite transporter (DMT)-like permease